MRLNVYAQAGVPKTMPWIFLITDGAPTDDWHRGAERVRAKEGEVAFFAVGVGSDADMRTLGQIASPNRPPVRLDGLKFRELFEWLSRSFKSVSGSSPGQQVALPSPENWVQGWGQV
jgi:uncharacterized protein YegL